MTRLVSSLARIAVRAPEAASTALLAAGAAFVAAGVALPWLSLFRGLTPVSGFSLEGGPLAGIAFGAVGAILVAKRIGDGQVLRPLAVVLAAFVAVDAALVAIRISAYVAEPGPAGLLAQPAAGPGPWVTVIGAGLLAAGATLTPVTSQALSRSRRAWLVVAGLLLVAGWIHLLLTPAHLAESPVLGAGFLAAGIAEVGIALLAAFRPSVPAALATIGIGVGLVVVYVYAVVHGLPFPDAHDAAAPSGFTTETVDLLGIVTKVAEIGSIAIAFALLGEPARQRDQTIGTRSTSIDRTGR